VILAQDKEGDGGDGGSEDGGEKEAGDEGGEEETSSLAELDELVDPTGFEEDDSGNQA